MTAPTPGPWEWDGKFTVGIPHVDGTCYFRVPPEDARLIVMAPDLLKALRGSWHLCQSILAVRDGVPDEALSAFADGLQVIIAKAEGSS